MWPFSTKKVVVPAPEMLRCRDIPKKAVREAECETYPQKSRPLPCLSLTKVAERYAGQIHNIIDNLPLSENEIDQWVMPVVKNVIRLVHLLPASESNHHSGCGGLLFHSLEAAGVAVRLVDVTLFDAKALPNERYDNRPRWAAAVVALLLIHDVGKVCDLRVTDREGRVWNPNLQDLLAWLDETETDYFVDWRSDRVHKEHERRALRFAYRQVLPKALIEFLSSDGSDRILGAMEDALLLGQGPLASILAKADSQSIALDAARRKRLASDVTYVSSPLLTPIVDAMRANLESGKWKVNAADATVFVTSLGVLLRPSGQAGRDIRETAISRGHQGVPLGIDRLIQVLGEAGFIETGEAGEIISLNVEMCTERLRCVRFLAQERLFPEKVPEAVEAKLVEETDPHLPVKETKGLMLKPEQSTDYAALLKQGLQQSKQRSEVSTPSKKPVALTKTPPMAIWKAESKERLRPVTPDECAEVLSSPLNKTEATDFVRRLLSDVKVQLQSDGGSLVTERQEKSDSVVCSSLHVERVAENHGISSATFEALVQVLRVDERFSFDATAHEFRWRKD